MSSLSPVVLPPRVLTGPGEKWELPPDQREIAALLEDGTLLVATGHENDLHLMSLYDRLERAQVQFQVQVVDPHEIDRTYKAGIVQSGEELSASGEVLSHTQGEIIKIIRQACELRASDVHFIAAPDGKSKIRFRIDGLLTTVTRPRYQVVKDYASTIYQSMCDVADAQYMPHLDQSARVSKDFVDRLGLYGARVETKPRAPGSLMILRLLYNDAGLSTYEDLGYLPLQIQQIHRLLRLPYGINILSGPTGSGKSMTLKVTMGTLDEICEGAKHILTIEDPPEYSIDGEGVNQTPLVYDTTDPTAESKAWAGSITNAMRLDPDYLMIGEVRDLLAAVASLRGAMTGHGVWTTLHTNTAISILQRLQDLGVDPSLLFDPALLTGLINQNLVPKLCTGCRIPFIGNHSHLDSALVDRVRSCCTPETVFVRGPGCDECRQTGTRGRSVVAEIVMTNLRFMRVYREKGPAEARNYWVKNMGGITKHQHTIQRINEGYFDPAMAEAVVGPLDMDLYTLDQDEVAHAG